jgi:uncharacterized membrane protein
MTDEPLFPEWTDGVENEDWYDASSPWNALPGVRTGGELTKGERAADTVRNRMGSWGFVIAFVGFMAVWAVINSIVLNRDGWDPYPYILLNLFLSMLAGLQGAILLIAAKRADAIAAEQALSHLTISKTSSEIIRKLEAELIKNTHVTHTVYRLVGELNEIIKIGRARDDRKG